MKKLGMMARQSILILVPIMILVISLVYVGFSFSNNLNDLITTYEQESFEGTSLLLNADRDLYQALDGFYGIFMHERGSERYLEDKDFYYTNIDDIENRMNILQNIVSNNSIMANISLEGEEINVKQRLELFNKNFVIWKQASSDIIELYDEGAVLEELTEKINDSELLFDIARSEIDLMEDQLSLYPGLLADMHILETNKTLIVTYINVGVIAIASIIFLLINVRRLVNSINSIAVEENNLAKSLRMASTQLAGAGQQLSEGSTEQAASIEETSATMEETSSMVQQNAENTRQADSLSKEASSVAAEGVDKMKDMIASMAELKKSSSDISKIIKVIEEIAFQTNILALNAAVEAARAGEAGQGFAVVAAEVRSLAQKSAQAAKDTALIIDKNIELSGAGVTISEDVNKSLTNIVDKTKNVSLLISEIAAASEEQAKGTAQVNVAIGQMEKVVQSNAATAEESAAAAEQLKAQAQALEEVVVSLKILVTGEKDAKKNINALKIADTQSSISQSQEKRKLEYKHIVSPEDVIPLDDDDDF